MLRNATTLVSRGCCLAIALLVCLGPAADALGQESRERERGREVEQLTHLLHMLEQGIAALGELDRPDMRDMLGEVAQEVRTKIERAQRRRHEGEARERRPERGELTERQIIEHRLEVLRLAFKAMMEAERRDLAERVEHAIHSYELALEGNRGPDAQEVRRTAPKRDEVIELLGFAAHLYEQFGMPDRAENILHQRDALWPGWRERGEREVRREREQNRDREPNRERELGMRRLEMMKMARPALRESGRMDAAELLGRAIRAMEVNLEGREDAEARQVRERSPNLGQQIEILMLASKLWGEFGHETKAATLREYAREMLEDHREREARNARRNEQQRERERPREGRRGPTDFEAELIHRIESLQGRISEMEQMIRELRERR